MIKKKRKKLTSIKYLRNKLDYIFNLYIKLRDKKCILTGKSKKLHCSHYYDKKNSPFLRWDARNAHAMDERIHWLHHHGKAPDYSLWMFKNNSIEFMEQLSIDANKKVTIDRIYLINLIIYYQTLLLKYGIVVKVKGV